MSELCIMDIRRKVFPWNHLFLIFELQHVRCDKNDVLMTVSYSTVSFLDVIQKPHLFSFKYTTCHTAPHVIKLRFYPLVFIWVFLTRKKKITAIRFNFSNKAKNNLFKILRSIVLVHHYQKQCENMVDAATKKTLSNIPLLKTKAGPRDKDLWPTRLKEEYQALIQVLIFVFQ